MENIVINYAILSLIFSIIILILSIMYGFTSYKLKKYQRSILKVKDLLHMLDCKYCCNVYKEIEQFKDELSKPIKR